MRIIITGGTGLIGSTLAHNLSADGHEVIVLSRTPREKKGLLPPNVRLEHWDGISAAGWGALADGADAIVNLAGESIGGVRFPPPRWTLERKQRILQSRLRAGAAIMEALHDAKRRPGVLIQASAVGYYGSRGDETLTEDSPHGSGFVAQVCVDWEQSTAGAEALGVRRVVIRTGVVLDPRNNAFRSLILPFRFFVGGPIGNGRQYFPWIHIEDEVRAIRFLMENGQASGAYNLTAPQPLPNREVARILGRVMRRPSFVPVPAFALKLALGEVSSVVLDSQRVMPQRLQEAGFAFRFPDFEAAVRHLLGR